MFYLYVLKNLCMRFTRGPLLIEWKGSIQEVIGNTHAEEDPCPDLGAAGQFGQFGWTIRNGSIFVNCPIGAISPLVR